MNSIMKLYKYIFIALATISCTDGLEKINTNLNAPIAVQPQLLLRQVLYNYGEEMSYEGYVAGNLLAQHFTMVDFNLFDRHDLRSPQLGGNPWPIIYQNLRDNEILLNLARSAQANTVYEGPALILKAYMAAALTDIYGDVPYFEALLGKEGNVTPRYDNQEDIYTADDGILDNLRKGIDAIETYTGVQGLEGDILFNGDLNGWVRFANSLRVKYLIRISDRMDVSPELQTVFDEGNYIILNQENATFDFSNTQPNTFRMAILRAGDFNLFIMSETILEIMNDLRDPRMDVLFRPTASDPGVYSGFLNGPDASNTAISVADFSLTGTIFRENTGNLDANYMTSWETQFLLAEAAQRGIINANARSLYENGVTQAFNYWGTQIPEGYLSDGNAAFASNEQDPIEQILTQKWIANSINGYENWIEYRRTGFPKLKNVAASLNDNLIPNRMPYPGDEAAFNAANYQEAIRVNGNSINANVWWDSE